MAFPQNRSNAIAMPLDYLNEASEEVQRLFARLDDVERMLRKASEERRPMIGEERYLTGEEVCTRLHLSPRTLQTLRDRRQIPSRYLATACCSIPNRGSGRCLTATFGRLPTSFRFDGGRTETAESDSSRIESTNENRFTLLCCDKADLVAAFFLRCGPLMPRTDSCTRSASCPWLA